MVGFDDLPVARWVSPPLTTVRQPLAEMGRAAAQMLGELIEGTAAAARPGGAVHRAASCASPPPPREARGDPARATETTEIWRDPSRSADDRVADLLGRMTLEEKLAQLGSVWLGAPADGDGVAPMQDQFSDERRRWTSSSGTGSGS